jgi:hypothetical protein
MNRKALCEALGVTPCTTFNYQRLGMPSKKVNLRGTNWRHDFDLVKVKAWQRQYKRSQMLARKKIVSPEPRTENNQ